MTSTFCVVVSDGEQERVEGLFTDIESAENRCFRLIESKMAVAAQVMLMSPATGIIRQEAKVV